MKGTRDAVAHRVYLTLGDWGTDPTRCPPGHGLGVDGRPGQCPESWGILQNRYPYETSGWPWIATSTAFNADLAYGIWRACYEGYETWLNTVDRGSTYAAAISGAASGAGLSADGTPRRRTNTSAPCKAISHRALGRRRTLKNHNRGRRAP